MNLNRILPLNEQIIQSNKKIYVKTSQVAQW